MFKKLLLAFLLLLTVGCSSEQDAEENKTVIVESQNAESYGFYYDEKYNSSRYWHGDYLSKYDVIALPKGLEELSKDYYSTSEYVYGYPTILNRDDIRELQRYYSESAKYGLNSNEAIVISKDKEVNAPYLIYDIVELDFYKKKSSKVDGLSFALVFHSNFEIDGNNVKSEDQYLVDYFLKVVPRFYDYLKTEKNINVPVVVGLYRSSEMNSTLPGNFIYNCYFNADGKMSENSISNKWYYLPSTEIQSINNQLYTSFLSLKDSIMNFSIETTDIIGKVYTEDNMVKKVDIDIKTYAQTYTEISAMAKYVLQLINEINTYDYDVIIDISDFENTYYVIEKIAKNNNGVLIDLS